MFCFLPVAWLLCGPVAFLAAALLCPPSPPFSAAAIWLFSIGWFPRARGYVPASDISNLLLRFARLCWLCGRSCAAAVFVLLACASPVRGCALCSPGFLARTALPARARAGQRGFPACVWSEGSCYVACMHACHAVRLLLNLLSRHLPCFSCLLRHISSRSCPR
jgi:hypothetical protein